jgi:hypothetical protein
MLEYCFITHRSGPSGAHLLDHPFLPVRRNAGDNILEKERSGKNK